MIRAALALARLTVYRAAAIHILVGRRPYSIGSDGIPEHRLTQEQRAEVASDVESMAIAILSAERGAP